MKKILTLLIIFASLLLCCESNNDNDRSVIPVQFKFEHYWDETPVTKSDFNNIKFTNAFGNELSIERLRYLISKITFTTTSGETTILDTYKLIDLSNETSLEFNLPIGIQPGSYSNVSFIFGFTNEDNIDGAYVDLNSASWSVPASLGGGYHYLQIDGKFINTSNMESGYNYHAIRAVDDPGANPNFPQDTFYQVNLGQVTIVENSKIIISANIAQWFKDPYTWDLNLYNQMLMPNSTAQILMYQNGQNVFNLARIE